MNHASAPSRAHPDWDAELAALPREADRRIAAAPPGDPGAVPSPAVYRELTYLVCGLVVAVGGALVAPDAWRGQDAFPAHLELTATIVALLVGVVALLWFDAIKRESLLLLGIGFLATALFNGLDVLATSGVLRYFAPTPRDVLLPWTWLAGQTSLAIAALASYWNWQVQTRTGNYHPLSPAKLALLTTGLVVSVCLWLLIARLPTARPSLCPLGRPWEFVAGLLFLAALCGYLRKGKWRTDVFDHSVIVCLVMNAGLQFAVMPRSQAPFDALFDLAHLMKVAAYGAVLVGLLSSIHDAYRQASQSGERADELERQSLDLLATRAALVNMMEESEQARRKLEAAHASLSELNRAAESANRAKSEFLANMSHEIRTPMTAIVGFADELREKCPDPGAQEYVNTIQRNCRFLLEIINDILDLSKIEASELRLEQLPTSPAAVIGDVAHMFQLRAAEKGLQLQTVYLSPLPRQVRTDPTRFQQVLTNLVGNAVKFTCHGGVRIEASFQADATLCPLDNTHANPGSDGAGCAAAPPARRGLLVLRVVDTGIGLDQAALANLFKPFVQADASTTRRFGGTGLGLTISKQLVELLGGTIAAASEPGRGSVFTVTLPVVSDQDWEFVDAQPPALPQSSQSPAGPPAATDEKASNERRAAARVLLVEDGIDNQRLIAHLLRRAGAQVALAEHGAEALEAVEQSLRESSPFDVIFLDMQMPVMDGFTTVRRLRDRGLATPVVALTANALAGEREKCLAAGCDDFLTKPIDRATLVDRLHRWTAPAAVAATAG